MYVNDKKKRKKNHSYNQYYCNELYIIENVLEFSALEKSKLLQTVLNSNVFIYYDTLYCKRLIFKFITTGVYMMIHINI